MGSTLNSTEERKFCKAQCPSTVQEIRDIELCNIIPHDDVRVDFQEEFLPCHQQLLLVGERQNLASLD